MRARLTGDSVPPVPPPVRTEVTETLSPQILSLEHLDAFKKAAVNVLSTQLAEFTFAQIFDGLPTLPSFVEFHSLRNCDGHPATQHETLCDGSVKRFQAFRSAFDPLSLKFSPSVSLTYVNGH